ncbi:MAG: class I SAM-dependent methyltransferase [Pseudomonadota bacterium]
MIDTRLALALDEGGFALPDEGLIAVLNPPGDASLDALPQDRVRVIDGFKPSHDAWVRRGFKCQIEPDEGYAAVILCLPRSKTEARVMIAQAMSLTDGVVIVDGQKTDGVDSMLKAMRKRVEVTAPLAKAHGKLFACPVPDAQAFIDWRAGPALTPGGFWTAPGVFSADGIDPASALLAEALPRTLGRQVADFGAGWGFLSAHVLTRQEVEVVHLVEANHMALECARRNVTDERARFHWADAAQWPAPGPLDGIVMNPPFHTTRAADPALGQAFVDAAAKALAPKGQLWMVANRHLPYEQTLQDAFTNVFEIGGDARFKLFHATRPKRSLRR